MWYLQETDIEDKIRLKIKGWKKYIISTADKRLVANF